MEERIPTEQGAAPRVGGGQGAESTMPSPCGRAPRPPGLHGRRTPLPGQPRGLLHSARSCSPGRPTLLPAHLFHSVLYFISLASSLLLLSSSAAATTGGGTGAGRSFELHRTASGTLQIKFSDYFLLADDGKGEDDEEGDAAAQEEKQQ